VVPGSLTGLNVIPEMVTALRIHLTMILCESVSRIPDFGSIVYLDIFTVGSRSERMRSDGAVNEGLDGGCDIGCPNALNMTSGR
jgi:hypothetical protein